MLHFNLDSAKRYHLAACYGAALMESLSQDLGSL
jgi:hypothetical protein